MKAFVIPTSISILDLIKTADEKFPGIKYNSLKIDGGFYFDNKMIMEPADHLLKSVLEFSVMKDDSLVFGVKPPRLGHIIRVVHKSFPGIKTDTLYMSYVPGRIIENLIVSPSPRR